MLQFQTVPSATLELLKKIMNNPVFNTLRLVGGTGLALHIGHRISNDLDLFGSLTADKITIDAELNKMGRVVKLRETENIHIFIINDVKVDLVNYSYPWIEKAQKTDGIVLAGFQDIAAMKLAAINGRGTKKDFIDLFFLLKEYSLEQMLGFYSQKYHDGSIFMVLRSLVYFDDADPEPMPEMLLNVNWDDVKKTINEQVVGVSGEG